MHLVQYVASGSHPVHKAEMNDRPTEIQYNNNNKKKTISSWKALLIVLQVRSRGSLAGCWRLPWD